MWEKNTYLTEELLTGFLWILETQNLIIIILRLLLFYELNMFYKIKQLLYKR